MLLRPITFVSLLVTVGSLHAAVREPQAASTRGVETIVAYVSLLRLDLFKLLNLCRTKECQLLQRLDEVVAAEKVSDIGVQFLFSERTHIIDFTALGNQYGVNDRQGVVFIGNVSRWNGDPVVITSSVSPNRVSIVRVMGLEIDGRPTLSLIYDSFKNAKLLQDDGVPFGSITRIVVGESGKIRVSGRELGDTGKGPLTNYVLTPTNSGFDATISRSR